MIAPKLPFPDYRQSLSWLHVGPPVGFVTPRTAVRNVCWNLDDFLYDLI
jgi:hypothetical protein